MNYETTAEIEIAVALSFGWRSHLIVPRVSWGLSIHECDLLIVNKSGYAYEVEIKVSRSDLLKDMNKSHNHRDRQLRLRRLWFAVPEKLCDCYEYIPDTAGIFVVDRNGHVSEIRPAPIQAQARKLTETEQYKIARLGTLRMWALKQRLVLDKNKAIETSGARRI